MLEVQQAYEKDEPGDGSLAMFVSARILLKTGRLLSRWGFSYGL